MRASSLIATAVVLLLVAGAGAAGESRVRVLPSPGQRFSGWGLHASGSVARNVGSILDQPAAAALLLDGLRADIFEIVLPPQCYDGGLDNGSLNIAFVESSLLKVLDLVRKHRPDFSYYTVVETPPAAMKALQGGAGMYDLRPNGLRVDREDDLAAYVVNVFAFLESRGYPRPRFHSIQNATGYLSMTVADRCAYTPGQWARVHLKTRQALDRAGLGAVGLIGPDCADYATALEFAGGPAGERILRNPDLARSVAAFAFQGFVPLDGVSGETRERMAALCETMGRHTEVWMTSWAPFEAATQNDALVAVFQRMAWDFTRLGVHRWTWRPGYRRYRGTEALVCADAEPGVIYRALRRLWSVVRPGFTVRAVALDDDGALTVDLISENAFAFDGSDTRVVLLVNPCTQPHDYRVPRGEYARASVAGSADGFELTAPLAPPAADGNFRVQLPPRSVAIVQLQK